MEKVSINGQEVPVVFNLGTLMRYEELAGKSFFGESFDMMRERVTLVLSAIITADPDSPVEFGDILQTANFAEINNAFATVTRLGAAFFEMPAVVRQAEEREAEKAGEGKPKNSEAPTTSSQG